MDVLLDSLSVLWISPFRDQTALTLWCVYVGILLVFFYLQYRRITLGKILRALIDAGCDSPETAKSAEELGVRIGLFSEKDRLAVRISPEGGVDKFYLPRERMKKAAYFLKASGGGPLRLFLVIVLAYFVLMFAYYFGPSLLTLFEELNPFAVKTPTA